MKTIPEVDVYVRFCETDAGRHVSNTSYFCYLEEARTKFFTDIHFGFEQAGEENSFILARTECDFIAQAYAAQTLTIKSTVEHIGTKSFNLLHEICEKETGTLIARGRAVVVCFNFHEQRSVEIYPELRSTLQEYMGAESSQEV
jgi:acyl-CoA thioester hydrolase